MRMLLLPAMLSACQPLLVVEPPPGGGDGPPTACARLRFDRITGFRGDASAAFLLEGAFHVAVGGAEPAIYRVGENGTVARDEDLPLDRFEPYDALVRGGTLSIVGSSSIGHARVSNAGSDEVTALNSSGLLGPIYRILAGETPNDVFAIIDANAGGGAMRWNAGSWAPLIAEAPEGMNQVRGALANGPDGTVYLAVANRDLNDQQLYRYRDGALEGVPLRNMVTALARLDDRMIAGARGGALFDVTRDPPMLLPAAGVGGAGACGSDARSEDVEALATVGRRLFYMSCHSIAEGGTLECPAIAFPDYARLGSIRKAVVDESQILLVGLGGAIRVTVLP